MGRISTYTWLFYEINDIISVNIIIIGGITLAFIISSPCKDEKAAECVDVCPVDCIEEGKDMFYIDPDICIDCGACEAVCPVEAIYHEDELPEEENAYIEINRKFFQE